MIQTKYPSPTNSPKRNSKENVSHKLNMNAIESGSFTTPFKKGMTLCRLTVGSDIIELVIL